MDTNFHYTVVPSGSSKVSARVVFQDDLKQDDIVNKVATNTGLTAAQVIAVGTGLLSEIINGARSGRRARRLFNLMSFTPRCGGVHPDPDFQPTPANMNVPSRHPRPRRHGHDGKRHDVRTRRG